jgi:hypothetical protein
LAEDELCCWLDLALLGGEGLCAIDTLAIIASAVPVKKI